jgi:hypothetical protein
MSDTTNIKINLSMTADFKAPSCVPIIKFENGKLKMLSHKLSNKNIPIKVISIIGNGRTGKSTFFNCIATYLTGSNMNIFNVMDTDDHCTNGLDMFYFEDKNIVLLDCQGLKLDDSSNDHQLLLLTYLLSDCIIYNQKSLLHNDIFDTLQPLANFINCFENIDEINKPILYFRLSDVDLRFDVEKHLAKSMASKKDQYKNIRDALHKLFPVIKIGTTQPLDKSEKRSFDKKKFADVLLNTDNCFAKVIQDIIDVTDLAGAKISFNSWLSSIGAVIEKINKNEKIKLEDLDIYTALMENQIFKFRDELPQEKYLEIDVGALQESYISRVKPRERDVELILAEFSKKFSLVGSDIYVKCYKDINDKLMIPINKAHETMEKLAEEAIKSIEKSYFSTISNIEITPNTTSLKFSYRNKQNEINNIISKFLSTIEKYYERVYIKYVAKYTALSERFAAFIENEIVLESEKVKEMETIKLQIEKNWDNIYKILLKTNMLHSDELITEKYKTDVSIMNGNDSINYLKKLFNKSYDDERIDRDVRNNLLRIKGAMLLHFKRIFIKLFDNNDLIDKIDKFVEVNYDDFVSNNNKLLKCGNVTMLYETGRYLNIYYNMFLTYKITINFKNRIISKDNFDSKLYGDLIADLMKNIEIKFLDDRIIEKICRTKVEQNRLYVLDKKNLWIKNECEDDKYIHIIDCADNDNIKKIPKKRLYGNLSNMFECSDIDKRIIKREMHLTEFKKYLRKKFKKSVQIDKREIFTSILFDSDSWQLNILYREFIIYRDVLENRVTGIQIL